MSAAGRPKLAARAAAQRTRILDAAQKCFIEHGFHAASMAAVAATAGMSAGLIYRYFESKNAIVLAIIERELQGRRERIAALSASTDLVTAMVNAFRELQSPASGGMNAALFLEMSAEATRVPQIAEALLAADTLGRQEFADWMHRPEERGGLGIATGEANMRSLLMQLIFEGLAVRAARSPQLDPGELRQAIEPLITALIRNPAPDRRRRVEQGTT